MRTSKSIDLTRPPAGFAQRWSRPGLERLRAYQGVAEACSTSTYCYLIGNKKAIKAFLPTLEKWIEQYDYPFEFTTEASLNLADDGELLAMLKRSNFFAFSSASKAQIPKR